MNIVINCPHCNQEMAIDDSGVGQTVPCPTCNKDFVIPQGRPEEEVKKEREAAAAAAAPKKEEKKEEKPKMSKEELAALLPGAKKGGGDKKADEDKPGVRVECFQHHLCIDMGKDLFPSMVGKLLSSIAPEDVIAINPLSYSYKQSSGEVMQDFGVMIIYNYRGKSEDK